VSKRKATTTKIEENPKRTQIEKCFRQFFNGSISVKALKDSRLGREEEAEIELISI